MPDFANSSVFINISDITRSRKDSVLIIRNARSTKITQQEANIDIDCPELAIFLNQDVEPETREIFSEDGLKLADRYPDGRPKIAIKTTQFAKLSRSLAKETLHVVDSRITFTNFDVNNPNIFKKIEEILKTLSFIPGRKKVFFENCNFKNAVLDNQILRDLINEKKIVTSILNNLSIYSLEFMKSANQEKLEIEILAEALATNTSLTSLDLSSNNIGDSDVEALAKALKTNTGLISLDLCGNKLGNEGTEALAAALAINTSLTSLDLSSNNIGDIGAEALAVELATNTSLTSLNLRSNCIGERGERELAAATYFRHLIAPEKKLRISGVMLPNLSDDEKREIEEEVRTIQNSPANVINNPLVEKVSEDMERIWIL